MKYLSYLLVFLSFFLFASVASAQTLCNDGTYSHSSGSGACSYHGGVDDQHGNLDISLSGALALSSSATAFISGVSVAAYSQALNIFGSVIGFIGVNTSVAGIVSSVHSGNYTPNDYAVITGFSMLAIANLSFAIWDILEAADGDESEWHGPYFITATNDSVSIGYNSTF